VKIIVVGCGRFGSELATRLFVSGHKVIIIDRVGEAFNNLPSSFEGRSVEGDALNPDVLHRAEIQTAGALASVTDNDALNIAVGHLARKIFNVPVVVCRNYKPSCRPIFETFGLQVVSSSSWGAQRMEELIDHNDIKTLFSAGNGEVELYEIIVSEKCDGMRLSEIYDHEECRVVSITRAGMAFFPEDDHVLKTDDIVHVTATFAGIKRIRERICA
jgi:trk system potassium uptake protein TrkA